MNRKIQRVASDLKKAIASKYELLDFKVIGSTARNERRPESDIDIFVLLPQVDRHIEEDLFNIAYDLELENDCLIDLIVFGKEDKDAVLTRTPFYRQVIEEGVRV
jgi:predicted nucleotidyltransferase